MKTHSIILAFALILSSCYTYKTFDAEEYAAELSKSNETQTASTQNKRLTRSEIEAIKQRGSSNQNVSKVQSNNVNTTTTSTIDPASIKISDIIKPDQLYKVDFEGKQYTIEAKQWKADTLYAVLKGTEKELKFHQKDISDLKIRKFSKGRSDALTVAAYALGGVGVFLLLK